MRKYPLQSLATLFLVVAILLDKFSGLGDAIMTPLYVVSILLSLAGLFANRAEWKVKR